MTPLKQLASIAVPDASTLMISPFDKTALKDIEKAINTSDIGINPNNDGQNIRLNIPPMTQVRQAGADSSQHWLGLLMALPASCLVMLVAATICNCIKDVHGLSPSSLAQLAYESGAARIVSPHSFSHPLYVMDWPISAG